jgi:hypothetical protein
MVSLWTRHSTARPRRTRIAIQSLDEQPPPGPTLCRTVEEDAPAGVNFRLKREQQAQKLP